MFDKIKKVIEAKKSPEHEDPMQDAAESAATVLMEVAWADEQLTDREVVLVRKTLIELYAFSEEQVDALLVRAEWIRENGVGLHPQTRSLNEHLSHAEKVTFLTHLWKLNYIAEDSTYLFEEKVIRKVAELLHLRHSEFIQAKLDAKLVRPRSQKL